MEQLIIYELTCHIESYDHTNWCWAELECEVTVEGFGTAILSRFVSSPNVKSVWETQTADILPRQFSGTLCIAGHAKSLHP